MRTRTRTRTTAIIVILICICNATQIKTETVTKNNDTDTAANNGHDSNSNSNDHDLKLVMVGGDGPVFKSIEDGWEYQCNKTLGLTCQYVKSSTNNTHSCIDRIDELIESNQVDGIVADCSDALLPNNNNNNNNNNNTNTNSTTGNTTTSSVYQRAYDAGIPIVTFEATPPEGFPPHLIQAYVGTNQTELGHTLARLLKQLEPDGGKYVLVYPPRRNIVQLDRATGFRNEISDRIVTLDNHGQKHLTNESFWKERTEFNISDYYTTDEEVHPDYFQYMEDITETNPPTAIIFLLQTPMRDKKFVKFVDKHKKLGHDITYIGTDGDDFQLDLLRSQYIHGLVGQLPYDIGLKSAETLHKSVLFRRQQQQQQQQNLTENNNTNTYTDNVNVSSATTIMSINTDLVAYSIIPHALPDNEVDNNLIGPLKYIGYVCFGIITVLSLACLGWIIWNRKGFAVKASQPLFLIMTVAGVFIMACTLIPISFDDNGKPLEMYPSYAQCICMPVPWLFFTGFTVTFSALFSKTWRVNKFFHSKSAFSRITVSEYEVIAPFIILLSLNTIVLVTWTIVDPLKYERTFDLATDYWNREIRSTGMCESQNTVYFLVPLVISK